MTTEAKEPRAMKALRLSEAGEALIQEIADQIGLTWSEAARRMLCYSAQKMPKGWH